MKLKLTREQAQICGDPLNRGALIVVNAYAGSGKSTTLRLQPKRIVDKNFCTCVLTKLWPRRRDRLSRITCGRRRCVSYRHLKEAACWVRKH